MYYLIKNTLEECSAEQCHDASYPYVAVLTPEQWLAQSENFDMGIDLDMENEDIFTTKAEVNFDSLTGTFCIPVESAGTDVPESFSFALDEKGIIFIDKSANALNLVKRIKQTKKWRKPSLERFLYDFLEQIIHNDLRIMQRYELELDGIEKEIMLSSEHSFISVIHGDAKLSNMLFKDGKVVGFLDFDTVMTGSVPEEIADCIRSCCLSDNSLNKSAASKLIQGYLDASGEDKDIAELIPFSFKKICFELALRYYTDAISGNNYFKEHYPGYRLNRAKELLRLFMQFSF